MRFQPCGSSPHLAFQHARPSFSGCRTYTGAEAICFFSSAPMMPATFSELCLLIIDDDPVSLELVATLFMLEGAQVQKAEDGEAALRLLTASSAAVNAILMDSQMPGLSGVELIARLRALSDAPLIAMSGSQPPASLQAAADGFLMKPFMPSALLDLLANRTPQESEQDDNPIDAGTFDQLRSMMSAGAMQEIFHAVVEDLQKRIAQLNHAIDEGNLREAGRHGHAIKGGCAVAGAVEAARLGAAIEEAALLGTSDALTSIRTLAERLPAALARIQRMMDEKFPARD